jgi:AcrR family transcriptional regulator
MTVFNYFPHKEDLFFDREGEGMSLVREALSKRPRGEPPVRVLGRLAHELAAQKHPFAKFTADTVRFWDTVQQSATLLAGARELRDRFIANLAQVLAQAVNQPEGDPEAELFASMLVAAWIVAYAAAFRRLRKGEASRMIRLAFLNILDRGLKGISAAMKGTPYA